MKIRIIFSEYAATGKRYRMIDSYTIRTYTELDGIADNPDSVLCKSV